MSENLHDIDQLFRDGLEGREEAPPPHMWSELDQRLDKRKVASIAGKYHVMKWVAAVLFLISIGMAMYVLRVNNTSFVKADKNRPAQKSVYPSTSRYEPAQDPAAREKGTLPRNTAPAKERDSQANAVPPTTPPEDAVAADAEPSRKNSTASVSSKEKGPAAPTGKNASTTRTRLSLGSNAIHASNGLVKVPGRMGRNDVASRSGRFVPYSESDLKGGSTYGEPATGGSIAAVRPVTYADVSGGLMTRGNADPAALMPPFAVRKILPDSLSMASSTTIKLASSSTHGFTATFFYSPQLASTRVGNDGYWGGARYPEDDAKQLKNKEKNGSSWSAGALFDLRFTDRWSIGSGLILSTRITHMEPKMIHALRDQLGNVRYRFNCSYGYSYIDLKSGIQQPGGPVISPLSGDSARAVSSTNKLQYLSVPLVMKYHFGEGKLRFYTGFGLQGNFLISRQIETYIVKGFGNEYANTSDIRGLRSVYLSGILMAGATYQVTPSLGITVMPNAQIGLMSVTRMAPVKSYVSFYGLGAGISIKL